ncbi:Protein kinase [Acanthamoeba castellanii str. Neff]|uniref:Protein kinase n=1 Tax=Acanthamoeba castellanii (strain ATCC 30010 / Neff) TaxID=1257118 RepID=L8GUJ0_ACACF|nr:Protein kinase [Acanthamoeba castellanii str. Neff]ELR15776.1 Protein kinase [Acanthamoeba castellanii str. Neff]
MSKLRHPNVVMFMAACTRPPHLAIVMEYMALGSVFELLHNELVVALPMELCVKQCYQAAKGMHFLHSADIAHCDLKSLNLLLDAKWNVRVADFGLSSVRNAVERNWAGFVGSVAWTAPEVLNKMPDADYVLADVYSFGIVMWEMLTRRVPYEGLSPAQIAIQVICDGRRPTFPTALSRAINGSSDDDDDEDDDRKDCNEDGDDNTGSTHRKDNDNGQRDGDIDQTQSIDNVVITMQMRQTLADRARAIQQRTQHHYQEHEPACEFVSHLG